MKRKALIIAYPGERGDQYYCEGVNVDFASYPNFLQKPYGGLWDNTEIEKLFSPSKINLKSKLSLLKQYDYGLIVFCGHGYYSTSSQSTIIQLNKNEELDSDDLRIGAPKQTIILDCCRIKSSEVVLEAAMERLALKEERQFNNDDCLKYYNKRISECGSGIVVLHACSINEEANDDSQRGGYYSDSIINTATRWALDNDIDTNSSYDVLSVVQSHDRATPKVIKRSGNRQHPAIEKPRSEKYFPFCVVA